MSDYQPKSCCNCGKPVYQAMLLSGAPWRHQGTNAEECRFFAAPAATAACYPTAEEINALPEKVRQYIHDLATRCDKSGDVQTIAILKEDREALQKRVEELEAGLEGLLPKHEFGLFLEHNAHRGYYEPAERYLKNADEGDISDEMRKRCIETNQIWKLQWYPDNATSFYIVYAPTLRELLEGVKE